MEISDKDLDLMHYIDVSTLINEDAVTCAVYFYKLVFVMLNILKSKQFIPFSKFAVLDYFLELNTSIEEVFMRTYCFILIMRLKIRLILIMIKQLN